MWPSNLRPRCSRLLHGERGAALLMAMLVLLLMSALLVGFTAVVTSDQRYRFIDRDRNQSFYAASAGIEKMTADLGNLFLANVAPTPAQLTALTGGVPTIPRVMFQAPVAAQTVATSSLTRCAAPNTITTLGAPGYSLQFCAAPSGRPTTSSVTPIKSGPYEGLIAQQMPYQLDVTARTLSGGEVHLVRTLEAVAIPVFQFGIFSDVNLSFSAADDFDFGGRVHTNGTLFLAETNGKTLTLRDKVTAVGEVIRKQLSNGVSITAVSQTGTVRIAKSPGVFRTLAQTEGSMIDGPTGVVADQNEPTWHTVSLTAYNSWLRNGRTGARELKLPLITVGGSNPDLVRRPVPGEDVSNPVLLSERLFTKASLRVLLSDTAADITGLPGVTAAPPVLLDGSWRAAPPANGIGTYTVDPTHSPIARSTGILTAKIAGNVSAGTGRTINITGLSRGGYFAYPNSMTVTKGASTWTVVCGNKTAASFTGCNSTPAHTVNTTLPATLSATVNTIDGPIAVSMPLTATWMSSGPTQQTISVNTLPFAPHTFWVNDRLITCGGYNGVSQLTDCNVPVNIASNSDLTSSAAVPEGTGTIGGYLKIERGNPNGSWTDVTMEILSHGITGPNQDGAVCNPSPNAIVRLQRVADNNWNACPPLLNTSTDYWPNTLFDTREAVFRDSSPGAKALLGGVMHYIEIDAGNLSKWFAGAAPYAGSTGPQAQTDNGGFTVYFSDRRNNRNGASAETGDYGFEDVVNAGVANGIPNGALDNGEDVNSNSTLDTYGGVPNFNGVYNSVAAGSIAPLIAAARPTTSVDRGVAQVNRAIIFRRALKLANGANIRATGVTGLTIVAENPVYIQGDWNANGGFAGAHAATAVIADAVAVLSNSWNDSLSFESPYAIGGRARPADSYYRVAIISGKGPIFDKPSDVAAGSTFGTDGGAHSFLRMLEGPANSGTVHYTGSMATFFYNRQAVGPFKCCGSVVYGPPVRDYKFDVEFLNPALLPPNTPMFRDLNAVGFAQEMRPGK